MISTGIDDFCHFRISGCCPETRSGGRKAVDDKNGPDALRIKLMREARKAMGAKQKVWQLGVEDSPGEYQNHF